MFYLLIFLSALLIVFLSIPPIIKVAYQRRLFDARIGTGKIHKRMIPNFGGVAIFMAFLISSSLFIPSTILQEGNVLRAVALFLFMTGLKDDFISLSPAMKFVAQFTSAFIVALVADFRINNLHGIFGLAELSYTSSVFLTVFFIVGIVNAFNLIDGIDGLAGMLGLILSISYAYIFFKAGDPGYSQLAIALAGALIGFLFFNMNPAKIMMADSGSMILGFMAAIFSIRFTAIEGYQGLVLGSSLVNNPTGIVLAIIIVPVFDTLRVITLRIIGKKSPFKGDNNHLHHRLLSLGLSHFQTTFVLSLITILAMVTALALQELNAGQLISIMALSMLLINWILSLCIARNGNSSFSLNKTGRVIRHQANGPMDDKAVHSDIFYKIFKN